jgi:hypothetical protein
MAGVVFHLNAWKNLTKKEKQQNTPLTSEG